MAIIMPGGGSSGSPPIQQQQPQQQPIPGQPAQAPGAGPLQPTYAGLGLSGFNTDPSATIAQIMAAFAPQAQSAQQGFMDSMALSGLSGGPVQAGEQQLQGQLAAGLAPSLANAIQFSQGQGLEQALANAGMFNTNQMFNAGEATSAGQMLAQLFQQMNLAGMGGQQGIAGQAASNFPISQPLGGDLLGALGMAFGGH